MDQHYDRYRRECEEAGRLEFFEALVSDGMNSGFAAMLAMQSPPGTKGTERALMEGSHNAMDRMEASNRDYLLKTAKAAGISTQGKTFKSGLGKPNDPMAWVSGVDDVVAACKAKNLTCEGAVTHQGRPKAAKRAKVLAPDLMNKLVTRRLASDPKAAEQYQKSPKKTLTALKHELNDKHGPRKKT